ncbi:hypothetical protein RO3G_13303 [Rhizopus delemar RA 99-880]|uniref:2,3-diketo-5-methylthio-1-phosphopentane phosphatase n=1 Tax=Rhizopus delemar (strain RA 99-880 / ATCC MYA-4621 / FGSC 9543 / NRRL 43880) TaxID=246409 RepID=I1CJG2_RHIO9|nr:hypothetical protein RO3G_13303 [Rhizopus delemar RA 99-880]|eukprot:EIE88592.1 hypothetical protein RO3G_13303 [Rhizopus delemar RA 99-880]
MSKVNIQVFTDFDGTLSVDGMLFTKVSTVYRLLTGIFVDTGILLIDDHRSLGTERRKALDHAILNGTKTYRFRSRNNLFVAMLINTENRDALQEMWNNVHISWEEAWRDHLDRMEIFDMQANNCKIDPGFPSFNDYCLENNFPVTVLSRTEHGKLFGEMIALIEAREAAPKNTIFIFCGDGVSDISAARHADVLFARKGRDLEIYCERENIPFIPFDTFEEIEQVTRNLVEGKSIVERSETGFSLKL